ncbi:MAG: MinD/ParA family protein, partial [Rhodococcus sp. (in: high G+C Gram-positive bacteria)]
MNRQDVKHPPNSGQPAWLSEAPQPAPPPVPTPEPAVRPQEAWTAPPPPSSQQQVTNQDLVAEALLKRPKRTPRGGWRRGLHRATGGVVNLGESTNEQRNRALAARIEQPIRNDYRIALLSLKGGVGKTTVTVGLGATFASLRGDCVVAVDANPDFGTLAQRVPLQTNSTVRDLIAARPDIKSYSDVRVHTSQSPSRLEVLASEQDPAISEAFSEADYRQVIDILQVYYNIILTDCGTGIMHSAMNGVLDLA